MRLKIFALLLTLFASFTAAAGPSEPGVLPATQDLAALAEQARERRLPILVMFSQRGCPYCTVVEEEFLEPMMRSGDYQDKVIMRRVMVDSFTPITDFDGQEVEANAFASRYRGYLTPTVVFLDARGRQLAPPVVGITTVDFYGGKLDAAIEESLSRLRPQASLSAP